MRWRRDRRVPERSTLGVRDLAAEATAGILQRPARSLLTTLGTVLGVGAFVAVLGLTSTAAGQISSHFDALKQTTVTVTDVGDGRERDKDAPAPVAFPGDADQRVTALNGAVGAGVFWPVSLSKPVIGASVAVTARSSGNAGDLPVYAASAGLFGAIEPTVRVGRVFDRFHDRRGERVAVLGAAAAARLGISQLHAQPAVFINGAAFTVVGIIDDAERLPELLLGIIVPRGTAERMYRPPDPTISPAQMVIRTRLGAAQLIARQAALALRPDRPDLLQATPPADPHQLSDSVSGELTGLFLTLAAICLVIGAVGITNTTLVAVLERVGEIGLRRSLGARPRHIAAQFLTESTVLGTVGGLTGTALGVGVVLTVALVRDWTAVLDPATVLPAPLIGSVVGMLAGLYPALRAATTEPLEALRR
ncbi:ABC transporter permease [Micromonospora phytophila]|uniref:ABC transporter permease n=1 Tax=Micromonospora phytophila TaxID=709888 RepID=UPI002030B3BB|nr:ABC transporter permease [Micromonospora phytophila]MCM0676616.1 ABC transporter permease [Micromonospora phytophila]